MCPSDFLGTRGSLGTNLGHNRSPVERFTRKTPENPVVFVQINPHTDHIYSLMASSPLLQACEGRRDGKERRAAGGIFPCDTASTPQTVPRDGAEHKNAKWHEQIFVKVCAILCQKLPIAWVDATSMAMLQNVTKCYTFGHPGGDVSLPRWKWQLPACHFLMPNVAKSATPGRRRGALRRFEALLADSHTSLTDGSLGKCLTLRGSKSETF
jgi:hypothetical protein